MNINDIAAQRECTSCQICAAVCPFKAIDIDLNKEGFYRPFVNDKCTDCGVCVKSCYKFDSSIKMTSAQEEEAITVYAAQSLSDSLLKNVTSGGVSDALAKKLISEGYVCIGVTYNDKNHRAEHIVTTSAIETDAFRGSKYIQSYSVDAFKELVKNCKTTKFAVFGLPCDIYAIHKYLSLRKLRDNCILIDLFCHGCPSMHVWSKYEQRIKNQVHDKTFDEVHFRSKIRDWGNFYVVVVVVEGVKAFISSPKQDEFYSLFFSDHVLNDSCPDCQLRSTMAYTDIRLGDFWGKRYVSDKKGISAVALASEAGRKLFDKIQEQFKIEKRTMSEVIAGQSYGKTYTVDHSLRQDMLDSLCNKNIPLSDAVDIFYKKQGIAYKAMRLFKTINWYLPFDLIRILKRLR